MELELGHVKNDLKRWIDDYYLTPEVKDFSKNTLLVYNRIIDALFSYVSADNSLERMKDLDKSFFRRFIDYLEKISKNGKLSPKTKLLYVSILKSLFSHISAENTDKDGTFTFNTEFDGLVSKKSKSKKNIKYLTNDEVDRIISYLDANTRDSSHYSYIYALAIKLMMFSGLRASEVLNLTLNDFSVSDQENGEGEQDLYEIHLEETKSGDQQKTYIPIWRIEFELEYFHNLIGDNEFIFKAKNALDDEVIKRNNLYRAVNQILRKIGIKKKGLHLFRHTCAMRAYRKSGNILAVKQLLRHKDEKTTMIYADAEDQDAAELVR